MTVRIAAVGAALLAGIVLTGCPAPEETSQAGTGSGGSQVADTVAPTTPAGVTAVASSPSSINVSWTASADNVAVRGYAVYRDGAGSPLLPLLGTVTTFQDTGLSPNTTHSYRVAAYDEAGNFSAQSSPASATTPAPDTTPPSNPTGLTASAISSAQINLSWTSSSDNVGVTGYRVFRDGALVATLGDVISYQNTGLTANTAYAYYVVAFDAAGNTSGPSATANATTLAPDVTPPSDPTGLTASAISGSQINLGWAASTDNVAVTGYKVYRDGSLAATLGNVTAYQNSGLAPGTFYSFTVSAIDGAGNESGQSPAATATTLAANASVTLEWDAVAHPDLGGYRVYFSHTNQSNYQAAGQGVDVGNVTEYTVTGLVPGTRYYFKATAYYTSNVESSFSNEIFTDIP